MILNTILILFIFESVNVYKFLSNMFDKLNYILIVLIIIIIYKLINYYIQNKNHPKSIEELNNINISNNKKSIIIENNIFDKMYNYYYEDISTFREYVDIILADSTLQEISIGLMDFGNIKNKNTNNLFNEFHRNYVCDYIDDKKELSNGEGFINNFHNIKIYYNSLKNDEEKFIITNTLGLIYINSSLCYLYIDKNDFTLKYEDENYIEIYKNKDIRNFINNNMNYLLPEIKYLINNPFENFYTVDSGKKCKYLNDIYKDYLSKYVDENIDEKYEKL